MHRKCKELRGTVSKFWSQNQEKFMSVWRVLDASGKTKYANACVRACRDMTRMTLQCNEPELVAACLFPEINVSKIVDDPDHMAHLFEYYLDPKFGIQQDEDLVDTLIQQDTIASDEQGEKAKALRQMGILQTLQQASMVYESVWAKGTSKDQEKNREEIKKILSAQAYSLQNDICLNCGKKGTKLCFRCRKVKYCSRECQVAHWKKQHKKYCNKLDQQIIDPKALLKKKLKQAMKSAKDKSGGKGQRIRTRR